MTLTLNPNGSDSCQTELDPWQRPAPEWPPESGVPQQPIRGLGSHISTSVAIPLSSTHRHRVSVLRYRTMWSCWTRPLRLQRQGQRQMVDQQQQGLRRRRHRREASSKRQIFLGCLGKCKRCLGNVFICMVFNLIGTFKDIQRNNEGEQIWHFLNLGKKRNCAQRVNWSWSKCHVQWTRPAALEVHCYESSAFRFRKTSINLWLWDFDDTMGFPDCKNGGDWGLLSLQLLWVVDQPPAAHCEPPSFCLKIKVRIKDERSEDP